MKTKKLMAAMAVMIMIATSLMVLADENSTNVSAADEELTLDQIAASQTTYWIKVTKNDSQYVIKQQTGGTPCKVIVNHDAIVASNSVNEPGELAIGENCKITVNNGCVLYVEIIEIDKGSIDCYGTIALKSALKTTKGVVTVRANGTIQNANYNMVIEGKNDLCIEVLGMIAPSNGDMIITASDSNICFKSDCVLTNAVNIYKGHDYNIVFDCNVQLIKVFEAMENTKIFLRNDTVQRIQTNAGCPAISSMFRPMSDGSVKLLYEYHNEAYRVDSKGNVTRGCFLSIDGGSAFKCKTTFAYADVNSVVNLETVFGIEKIGGYKITKWECVKNDGSIVSIDDPEQFKCEDSCYIKITTEQTTEDWTIHIVVTIILAILAIASPIALWSMKKKFGEE